VQKEAVIASEAAPPGASPPSRARRPSDTTVVDPAPSPPPPAVDAAPSPQHAGGRVGLVVALCEALGASGVAYCHWKSNESIARSERAESDLDLLVARRDAGRFEQILRTLGFKHGRQAPNRQLPGLFHAFGLDDATGALVHIHAHYQLVLGDDTTKNYRLPVEDAYLASARQGDVFKIPAPEFELVVFVLRMMLKHATWDAVATGKGSLSAGERRELTYLRDRAEPDRARAIVRKHLPFIPAELWRACVGSVDGGDRSPSRIRAARRLEVALAGQSRRSPNVDPLVRTWRRIETAVARRVRRRPMRRSRLDDGGAIVAVVGGDGAGKSTAVADLVGWLSRDLDVVALHLGKPRRSTISKGVDVLWRGATAGASRRGPSPLSDAQPMTPRRLLKLVRKVMISRDRYLEYTRGRRFAAEGGIVVCDRFPLPQIRLMDAPATGSIPGARRSSVAVRLLARVEERYYARIGRPDILVVLRVDPDVAVRRREGIESEEMVRARAEEIWRLQWGDVPAVVVDAGQPRDAMLAEIKAAIWERL
jgi:thymidylate kinase